MIPIYYHEKNQENLVKEVDELKKSSINKQAFEARLNLIKDTNLISKLPNLFMYLEQREKLINNYQVIKENSNNTDTLDDITDLIDKYNDNIRNLLKL